MFVRADFVTSQFFAAVGVRPRLGRLLTDEEADRGGGGVLVSEHLWRTLLGGTGDPVGRQIRVNRKLFTVAGVVADGFRGWARSTHVGETDL